MAAARGRLQRLGLSKADIEQVSTKNGTSALDGLVSIRASRAGTVIEGNVAPGERAEAGKELLTLSDLATVWVMADVKETELAAIANASGREARIDAMGCGFGGRLETVSGRMSETTRTAKARFSVDNAEGLLKPGCSFRHASCCPAAVNRSSCPKSRSWPMRDGPLSLPTKRGHTGSGVLSPLGPG